ncbi:hypothetical protein WR25_00224 [Diploscapter pachys]|uniref:Uncharacterized protein n=1 Tax=Diploscapter pachys TaxID=2018661 RepID=A0A2A2K2U1_9BILA|nr:hypothetical protein WR25_00224 [Diploscapter pachys]
MRAPTFFMIEVAADGPWFDFASAAARRSVGIGDAALFVGAAIGLGDLAERLAGEQAPGRAAAPRQAGAFVLKQPLADRPAFAFAADEVVLRHLHVGEEGFAEGRRT